MSPYRSRVSHCRRPALALGTASAAPAQQTSPTTRINPTSRSYEEQVVVTASKTEEQLVNAPAAVSVISSETIQNSPATNIGDLLRAVPGVNVTQVSARDVNITTRGATSTLSTSQLALVDGRSVYLDFFGMVMWDLVPTNPDEIRQIEVIRGPASAVWGANAMTGVVNVITQVAARAGRAGRQLADDRRRHLRPQRHRTRHGRRRRSSTSTGRTRRRSTSDWAYKLSAGYFTQDPLPRPMGTIPNTFNTPYPSFTERGHEAAEVRCARRLRHRQQRRNGHRSPAAWRERRDSSTQRHRPVRHLERLPNELLHDALPEGRPSRRVLHEPAERQRLEPAGVRHQWPAAAARLRHQDVRRRSERRHAPIGTRTCSATAATSATTPSTSRWRPTGTTATKAAGICRTKSSSASHFRWVVGGRVDKFSSIDDAVFSPRTTFMMKPDAAQTFRVSFNRAFRAPSFINNNIDTTILNQVNLSALAPLPRCRRSSFRSARSATPTSSRRR